MEAEEKDAQDRGLSYDDAKDEILRSLVLVNRLAAGVVVPSFVARSDTHKVNEQGLLTMDFRRYKNTFDVTFHHGATETRINYFALAAASSCSN